MSKKASGGKTGKGNPINKTAASRIQSTSAKNTNSKSSQSGGCEQIS